MTTRRTFLRGLGAALTAGAALPHFAFADLPSDRRLVVVLLRGGLDGLAAVPPWADPDYRSARGKVALPGPDRTDGVIDLDGSFGLHPALGALHRHWMAGQLAPVHAVSLPYGKRSHFDAQNLLENGTDRPHGASDGWLNRALGVLGGRGLALGQEVPLMLQGAAPVMSLDPTEGSRTDEAFERALMELYADDALLFEGLNEGIAARELVEAHVDEDMDGRRRGRRGRKRDRALTAALDATGKLLVADDGPRVAMIHAGGWDTHQSQGGATGNLARKLTALGDGLDALAKALQPVWARTAIVVVTEFGRTVRANGTGGTDHGTASVALALGGAVRGGRVRGAWPGLAPQHLAGGRDLAGTTDMRALFKAALVDHLQLDRGLVEGSVFPDSRNIDPISDLFV